MSLRGDKYENLEEVNFRLANTVVLYEGKPVYVTRVTGPGDDDADQIARVFFVELPYTPQRLIDDYGEPIRNPKPSAKETRKYLSSKNFDLAPFRMGYFNHKGSAYFASRVPSRQNQQGLNQRNLSVTSILGVASKLSFGSVVASSGFHESLSGVFPSFGDVGDMLGGANVESVAVSRQFAFMIDNDLEALVLTHKGVKCGLALKGDKQLRIPSKYEFLKQEAEECRIPLA